MTGTCMSSGEILLKNPLPRIQAIILVVDDLSAGATMASATAPGPSSGRRRLFPPFIVREGRALCRRDSYRGDVAHLLEGGGRGQSD